ncbi:MAG: aspartate-semialdehyde dehydrogenase [Armatimonadetes bacterium]|nr:aspartate-semialdehyde dehydrogenase [Armatimonadota bacterium]
MPFRRPVRVAVVGATGAVGREFARLLEEREWPVDELSLFASKRSVGKRQPFKGDEVLVRECCSGGFKGVDIAFFSAGAEVSKTYAPCALESGAIVIDNSSAFRMRSDVPLVIPEINASEISATTRLIANPNCTAIILLMAIAPLRSLGKFERVVMTSYQSASGAGAAAMKELEEQSRAVLEGREAEPSVFPHQCAFNVFSHDSPIGETGMNVEEEKVIEETRKILGMPDLKVNATCVRVPVFRAHSVSVLVEFSGEAPGIDAARSAIADFSGVRLVDDREKNHFPMPVEASGQNDVLVGRIRQDPSSRNGLCLFASGDQLLKGAALNAVQIAECAPIVEALS